MGDSDALHQDAHRFAPAASDEEYVFGACCPGWHSAGTHVACIEQWIDDMREAGIERVCCLLAGRQLDENEANLDKYEDAFGADKLLHAPVPDQHLVDEALLNDEILPFLDDGKRSGEPVVVHGLSGIGRTGQVLAAWLVYDRDHLPTEAISTVTAQGRDPRVPVFEGYATESELIERLESAANWE